MKKIMSSKFVALGLALFMVISILGTSLAPAGQIFAEAGAGAGLEATAAERINVADATYAAAEYLLKGGVQSDWQAIGLAQAGTSCRLVTFQSLRKSKGCSWRFHQCNRLCSNRARSESDWCRSY